MWQQTNFRAVSVVMARVNLFKDGKDQIGSVMGYLDSNNAECREKLKDILDLENLVTKKTYISIDKNKYYR